MKIVIDIPEKRFADIQRIASVQLDRRTDTVEQIIANGTPLPKGHGRLVDADAVITEAIEVLQTEKECVERQGTYACPNRDCENCDLLLPTEKVIEGYNMAIKALSAEPIEIRNLPNL